MIRKIEIYKTDAEYIGVELGGSIPKFVVANRDPGSAISVDISKKMLDKLIKELTLIREQMNYEV